MNTTKKRKLDSIRADDTPKKLKMSSTSVPRSLPLQEPSKSPPQRLENASESPSTRYAPENGTETSKSQRNEQNAVIPVSQGNKTRPKINKLAPPRPFPTVPTSVSATGPRSGHREGKNMICMSRKTSLGNYMRRCKDVILIDGYKTLHLSAMGAAIPLLTQLLCALPPILPFSQDEIHTEINTDTVEVRDEVLPEDENEDLQYQTRDKSVLRVVFKIGNGEYEGDKTASRKYSAGKTIGKSYSRTAESKGTDGKRDQQSGTRKPIVKASEVVLEEPEQEYMDMI